jgi:hypothetical protein
LTESTAEARRVGRRAVNKARSFFEENGLIYQDVHLENDIGVDAYLTLASSGPNAGLSVRIQVKGRRKYKRALHVEERQRRLGFASFRSSDWKISLTSPLGFEGHHVIAMNERLRDIWRNSRPIYAIIQDPDDGELYFGNLARMADVLPLAQDLASSYDPDHPDRYSGRRASLGRYLERLHRQISRLNDEELRVHETWLPLYQDWKLTPEGLERFLETASKEAAQPLPDYVPYVGGEVPIYVTYPDGTIGPSREALDAERRLGLRATAL